MMICEKGKLELWFVSCFADDKTGTLDGALDNVYCRSQMYLSRQMSRLRPELTMPIFSGFYYMLKRKNGTLINFYLFFLYRMLRDDTSLSNSQNRRSFFATAMLIAMARKHGITSFECSCFNITALVHYVLSWFRAQREKRRIRFDWSYGNDSQQLVLHHSQGEFHLNFVVLQHYWAELCTMYSRKSGIFTFIFTSNVSGIFSNTTYKSLFYLKNPSCNNCLNWFRISSSRTPMDEKSKSCGVFLRNAGRTT